MLKALLKKQLLEINQFYFTNRKTGKVRSKNGAVGMMILFALLFLLIAFSVYGGGAFLAYSLTAAGNGWLYFVMMYIASIMLGVLGSVFNTYSGLYLAKDNDLLLSMPVKPGVILLSRMVGVCSMSLLYSGIIWIPAVAAYWIHGSTPFNILALIFQILLLVVIVAFVAVLTCILGWVVAKVAVRIKNNRVITMAIAVVLFALYFMVCFNANSIFEGLITNMTKIGDSISTWVYPLYQFGLAATGQILPMIITVAIVGALFAVTYFVLSRSFIKIITTNTGEHKKQHKETKVSAQKPEKALFVKELKRFTSSTTYMLNTGIGLIFLPALVVLAIIYVDDITGMLGSLPGINMSQLIAVFLVAIVGIVTSMNAISAPSVSLEGNQIWILQSMPIDTWKILRAKIIPHIVINGTVSLVCSVALTIIFRLDLLTAILTVVMILLIICLNGSFGVMMNLLKPNLNWTTETVVIKQSMSVMISLFGGWFFSMIIIALGYVTMNILSTQMYMVCMSVLILVLLLLVIKWLKGKGSRIFEEL